MYATRGQEMAILVFACLQKVATEGSTQPQLGSFVQHVNIYLSLTLPFSSRFVLSRTHSTGSRSNIPLTLNNFTATLQLLALATKEL